MATFVNINNIVLHFFESFQSPYGDSVNGDDLMVQLVVGHTKVSVPLRGFSEWRPGYCEVSVPLRGFSEWRLVWRSHFILVEWFQSPYGDSVNGDFLPLS